MADPVHFFFSAKKVFSQRNLTGRFGTWRLNLVEISSQQGGTGNWIKEIRSGRDRDRSQNYPVAAFRLPAKTFYGMKILEGLPRKFARKPKKI